jgi:hypothetical protein
MRIKLVPTFACLLASVLGFTTASRAADRTEAVHFAKGHSSATLKGSVKGDNGVVYQIGAAEGQTMSVLFAPSNGSCYFNVLPPGSSGEAIFIGSTSGNEFAGTLGASGTYGIQVYLMRNAARRNEACKYSLTVEIRGGEAATVAPKAAKGAGSGPVVSRGNMAAHCRGEASSMYGVKPAYIMTGQINDAAGGGSTIDGTADQGTNGTKKFQCRFDAAGHFAEVMPLDSDGE